MVVVCLSVRTFTGMTKEDLISTLHFEQYFTSLTLI